MNSAVNNLNYIRYFIALHNLKLCLLILSLGYRSHQSNKTVRKHLTFACVKQKFTKKCDIHSYCLSKQNLMLQKKMFNFIFTTEDSKYMYNVNV